MYAPEMTPFAIAVGKSMYARRVKGIESAANKAGGITRRSLWHDGQYKLYSMSNVDIPIHWEVMVNTMQ